jgi:replicative DNA helicase
MGRWAMNNYEEDSNFAEQSVIGSLIRLSDPESNALIKTMGMLKESSFYHQFHRKIFAAINVLYRTNAYIDFVTLEAQCKRMGEDRPELFSYLAEITRSTPSPANVISYAKIVRECAIERFAVNKMQDLIATLSDKTAGDVYQRLGLMETAISDINNMSLRNEKGGLKHISEALGGWLDNIEQVQLDGYDKNAFTTGVESVDEVLGVKGMRRGSLVGVGARPKMGKSAFMSLVANHFALNLNEAVALFSMEMPDVEIAERAMTNRTMINPAEFYREMGSESQGRLDTAFSEMVKSNMYVDDGSALSLRHIQKESRKIRAEKGSIGLICVDYLTLMEAEKADTNSLAYGMITKGLKNLAKELNCVVVLLLQLNRGLESRPDKRPMASDSRDTGQIEQDVDLWMGLYKDSVYNDELPDNDGFTEVLVRLNRHGGTGTGFVDMREGFHVPMSTLDGARVLNDREQSKIKAAEYQTGKATFKRK